MKLKLALVAVVSALANVQTAMSVPVVPNFTQGSMTSNTETTSTVAETINSMNYDTGYQYVITGTNISHDGNTISSPSTTGNSNTLNGVTSTWTGLDLNNKPNFTLTTPGEAFQFTESYSGPGLSNHTIIQRTTTIQSVTNTTSTFSNWFQSVYLVLFHHRSLLISVVFLRQQIPWPTLQAPWPIKQYKYYKAHILQTLMVMAYNVKALPWTLHPFSPEILP